MEDRAARAGRGCDTAGEAGAGRGHSARNSLRVGEAERGSGRAMSTLSIMYATAESRTSVQGIPTSASTFAVCAPVPSGRPSVT